MNGFNGILDIGKERRSEDDNRQINRWKIIVNRFVYILKSKKLKKLKKEKVVKRLNRFCYISAIN